MPTRRLLALAAIVAGACWLFYAASTGPTGGRAGWPPSSPVRGAPVSLEPPSVGFAGAYGDDLAIDPQWDKWASSGNLRFSARYFWLRCDLHGSNCSPIAGLDRRTIIPPQGLALYTIRGAVTATNARGSTTVVSKNFFWVHAGIPLDWRGRPQYDPKQLRAWYGLRPGQNGAGETIAIVDLDRSPGLRSAVDHFSVHYGLPRPCAAGRRPPNCFRLKVSAIFVHARSLPKDRFDEAELDVEWAHAVAPQAKIVVLEADSVGQAAEAFSYFAAGSAHVLSSSWCEPCGGDVPAARRVYSELAAQCGREPVVCTFAAGDRDSPGDVPSNSPDVLAVGGAMFSSRPDGAAREETAWPHGGFGETAVRRPRPPWQRRLPCSRDGGAFSCAGRAVPDVSATAVGAPTFGPTLGRLGWFIARGTSLSSPLWAALVALADQKLQRDGQGPIGIGGLHQVLYRGYVNAALDDIPPRGWDWATGLGAPKAGIVDVLAQAIERYRRDHCLGCWVARSD